MEIVLIVLWIAVVVIALVVAERNKTYNLRQSKASRYIEDEASRYGELSPMIVCPQCQMKGQVRTKKVTQKKGVSGGKATAALLTGGISLLAVGLSRKEGVTEARCGKCKSVWHWS